MGGFISCERTSRNQKVVALIGRKTAGEEQSVLKKEHVTGVTRDKDADIEFGIHGTANCRTIAIMHRHRDAQVGIDRILYTQDSECFRSN